MYLSKLVLNPRSRQVRREVAAPYELHRTLMRAFPGQSEGGPGRVLYRLDVDRETDSLTILVQSQREPRWSSPAVDEHYFAEAPQYKPFNPSFSPGQRLVFRLRANPTLKRDGRRFGLLREEDQVAWLKRKGGAGGFNVLSVRVIPQGISRGRKPGKADGLDFSHLAVLFDGILEVVTAEVFVATLSGGIGSAKGFGFGLLSVARA